MDTEAIKRSLDASGLRCTAQRYAVMAFLMEHKGHPTAAPVDSIWKAHATTTSFATVAAALRTSTGTTCPSLPRVHSGSELFVNANLFLEDSARSALASMLRVNCANRS